MTALCGWESLLYTALPQQGGLHWGAGCVQLGTRGQPGSASVRPCQGDLKGEMRLMQ